MDLHLHGKTALVTASSGGIGFAIARSLAREGVRVVVNGRSEVTVANAIGTLKKELPKADLIPLVTDNGTAKGCDKTVATLPPPSISSSTISASMKPSASSTKAMPTGRDCSRPTS
jgi:3-oxoacyl-[acyl-carrier protein] reductase